MAASRTCRILSRKASKVPLRPLSRKTSQRFPQNRRLSRKTSQGFPVRPLSLSFSFRFARSSRKSAFLQNGFVAEIKCFLRESGLNGTLEAWLAFHFSMVLGFTGKQL